MAAKILVLAFTLIIWEANTQQCGESIFINPLRPPLAEESQINNPCSLPISEESPIFVNPLRAQFKTKLPFTEGSLSKYSNLPVPRVKLSEISTPLFKGPSLSVKCTSSEPLSPLSVKTSLSNASQNSILDCTQSLISNSGNGLLLSTEKPIKFYGPPVNVEVNNIPIILPKPLTDVFNPFNSNSINVIPSCNEASAFDCSINSFEVEPPILSPSFPQGIIPNCFTRPTPVTANTRPVTDITSTTRGFKEILSSFNNDLPCCDTLESSVPSISAAEASSSVSVQPPLRSNLIFLKPVYNFIPQSITQSSAVAEVTNESFESTVNSAEATTSVSSGLGQASSSAAALNINPFGAGQINPSPCSSNIFGCPATDPTCSYTSIPPVSRSPTYQYSVNVAEATSSISSSAGQAASSSSLSNIYPFNIRQVSPNPYSTNTFSCPDTDPTCSYTSIPPVSMTPSCKFSTNVAEASSVSLGTGLSSATSFSAGKVSSNLANPYSSNNAPASSSYQPSNFMQTSSTASSQQVNPNLATPYSFNIFGCPATHPTCSYTSIPPVSMIPPCQSSVNVAETTSSASSGLGQASSSAASLNINPFRIGQINPSPYSSNVFGCPETDPTCSFTSIPPVSMIPPCQSSLNIAEASSSISSSFGSSFVPSFGAGQVNTIPISSTFQSSANSVSSFISPSSGQAACINISPTSCPIVASEISSTVSSAATADSTSSCATSYAASQSTSTASNSEVATSSIAVSETTSPLSTFFATTDSRSSVPLAQNTLLPGTCSVDQVTPVIETTATSTATSSSPTNVVTSTSSVSSTSIDTTKVVEQSASTLPVTSSFYSIPSSYSMFSPTFALAVSNPSQNMFTLEIDPLILEVEIPSSIRSSIESYNLPRSYGPHEIKIPSCIPAQLSCSLRSRAC